MSLLDAGEIEGLLAEARVTSMTEIVTFIADHVAKIALNEVAQLQERVLQLQRPKGMDRVMIEQVKALVQAMIDQREQSLRREMDRRYRQNLCSSFDMHEQSRRSLNQIDFANFQNTCTLPNGSQSQQLRRGSTSLAQPAQPKTDALLGQVRQLREEILNRAERRELGEVRQTVGMLEKELVSKVTFEEAEKLMLRFQKEIWTRVGEGRGWAQEVEGRVLRAVATESESLRQELNQVSKAKQVSAKMERKLKKYLEEMAYVRSDLQKLQKTVIEGAAQCKGKHKSQLDNLQTLQGLVEQIADDKQSLLLKETQRNHHGSLSVFMSAPISFKNGCVAWQRQVSNCQPGNVQFDSGKTNIRVTNTGFYEIGCFIYGGGGKKAPTVLCNSECIGRLECKNGSGELVPRWQFREWVHIRQNRSTISVKCDGDENNSCILLYISKVS